MHRFESTGIDTAANEPVLHEGVQITTVQGATLSQVNRVGRVSRGLNLPSTR